MELSTSDSISGSVFLFLATFDQTLRLIERCDQNLGFSVTLTYLSDSQSFVDPLCGIHKSRCFCSIPMIVTDSLHSFSDVPVLESSFA